MSFFPEEDTLKVVRPAGKLNGSATKMTAQLKLMDNNGAQIGIIWMKIPGLHVLRANMINSKLLMKL